MHTVWSAQMLIDDRRRGLLDAGDASRLARAARRGERPAARCTPPAASALRSAVGWWLVHAGLRLAAGARPAVPRQPG
ncbi:hypothetical protein K6U06_11575 [Acidiferrimicrobium sp. IK]|uniref:hypothetical protein n=1 Tax=Acidiferrimicrobium sp. IK TaxID=2871700 RepID=UPI0021CB7F8E|nr:hypothetical protein [Acidiferrimicrobium sp. IK]MCU4185003.1 hypothetical protein [Acidiferrimicrobium sp. IK]